jgi:hypothetical protein
MYFDLYTSRRQSGRPNIHSSQRAFSDINSVIKNAFNIWIALFITERPSSTFEDPV